MGCGGLVMVCVVCARAGEDATAAVSGSGRGHSLAARSPPPPPRPSTNRESRFVASVIVRVRRERETMADRSAFRVAGALRASGDDASSSQSSVSNGLAQVTALEEQALIEERQLAMMRLAQELLDLGLPLPDFESPESLLDTLDRCVVCRQYHQPATSTWKRCRSLTRFVDWI